MKKKLNYSQFTKNTYIQEAKNERWKRYSGYISCRLKTSGNERMNSFIRYWLNSHMQNSHTNTHSLIHSEGVKFKL